MSEAPFTWTRADREKLTRGATVMYQVTVNGVIEKTESHTLVGHLRKRVCVWYVDGDYDVVFTLPGKDGCYEAVPLRRCDPSSVVDPEPGFVLQ